MQAPYRLVKAGKPSDEVHYLDASEEERFLIAQANNPIEAKSGKLIGPVLVRTRDEEFELVRPSRSTTWTSPRSRSCPSRRH